MPPTIVITDAAAYRLALQRQGLDEHEQEAKMVQAGIITPAAQEAEQRRALAARVAPARQQMLHARAVAAAAAAREATEQAAAQRARYNARRASRNRIASAMSGRLVQTDRGPMWLR